MHLLEGGSAVNDLIPRWLARQVKREEEQQRERVAQLAATLRRAELLRKDGEPVSIPFADDQPRERWQAGLTLDILVSLPRLNSAALRKIADDCERLIAKRMEDGVFD